MDSSSRRGGAAKKWRAPMDEYLEKKKLWRKLIAKDGSCLFRAVAESLFHCQARHLDVRETCVGYMKAHKDDFSAFVEEPFERYLEKMKSPTAWGGQLEIEALSRLFSVDFVLYQEVGREPVQVTFNNSDKKIMLYFCDNQIRLCFCDNQIMLCFCDGHHYDCVYPLDFRAKAGFCQSILYDLLVKKVFKQTSSAQTKPGNDGDGKKDALPDNLLRCMMPTQYVNTEYERWRGAVKVQQQEDRAVAASIQFVPGDMCHVRLEGVLKEVQICELPPKEGPVKVVVVGQKRELVVPFYLLVPFNLRNTQKQGSGSSLERLSPPESRLPPQGDFIDPRRRRRGGRNKKDESEAWPSLPGQAAVDLSSTPQWVTSKAELASSGTASGKVDRCASPTTVSTKVQQSQGSAVDRGSVVAKSESAEKKEKKEKKGSTSRPAGNEIVSLVTTPNMSLGERGQAMPGSSATRTVTQKSAGPALGQAQPETKATSRQENVPESALPAGGEASSGLGESKGKGKGSSTSKKSTTQDAAVAVTGGGGGGGAKNMPPPTAAAVKTTGNSSRQVRKIVYQTGNTAKGAPFWKANADNKAKADTPSTVQQPQKVVQQLKKGNTARPEQQGKADGTKAKADGASSSRTSQASEAAKCIDKTDKKPLSHREKKRQKKAVEQTAGSAVVDPELEYSLALIRMHEEKSKEFPELSAANYARADHGGVRGNHIKSSGSGRLTSPENATGGKIERNKADVLSKDIGSCWNSDVFKSSDASLPWHAREPSPPVLGDDSIIDTSLSAMTSSSVGVGCSTSEDPISQGLEQHLEEDDEDPAESDGPSSPLSEESPTIASPERSAESSPQPSGGHSSVEGEDANLSGNHPHLRGLGSSEGVSTLLHQHSSEPMSAAESVTLHHLLQHMLYVRPDRLAHSLCSINRNHAISLLFHLLRSAGINFPYGVFPQELVNADDLPDRSSTQAIYKFGLEIYLAIHQVSQLARQHRQYEASFHSQRDRLLEKSKASASSGAPSKQVDARHLTNGIHTAQDESSRNCNADTRDKDDVAATESLAESSLANSTQVFVAKAVEEQARRQRASMWNGLSSIPASQENSFGVAGGLLPGLAQSVGSGFESNLWQSQAVSPTRQHSEAGLGQAKHGIRQSRMSTFQPNHTMGHNQLPTMPWDEYSPSVYDHSSHQDSNQKYDPHSAGNDKGHSQLPAEQSQPDHPQSHSNVLLSIQPNRRLNTQQPTVEGHHGLLQSSASPSVPASVTYEKSFPWLHKADGQKIQQQELYGYEQSEQQQLPYGLERQLDHIHNTVKLNAGIGQDAGKSSHAGQLASLASVLQPEEASKGKELIAEKHQPSTDWNYAVSQGLLQHSQKQNESTPHLEESHHGGSSFSDSYQLWQMLPTKQAQLHPEQSAEAAKRIQQWSPVPKHPHPVEQDQPRHLDHGSFHHQQPVHNSQHTLCSPEQFDPQPEHILHQLSPQHSFQQSQTSGSHQLPFSNAPHQQQYSQAPQPQPQPSHALQQVWQPPNPRAVQGQQLLQNSQSSYLHQLQHSYPSYPPQQPYQSTDQDPSQQQMHQVKGSSLAGLAHRASHAGQSSYEDRSVHTSDGDLLVSQQSTTPFSVTSGVTNGFSCVDNGTASQSMQAAGWPQYNTQVHGSSGMFSAKTSSSASQVDSARNASVGLKSEHPPIWQGDQRLNVSTPIAFRSSLPFPPTLYEVRQCK